MDPFAGRDMTESSKKLYMANLRRLAGNEFTSLKFLADTDAVLKRIAEMKPNTGRTYLIAVVSALKGKPRTKRLQKAYYDAMMTSNAALKDQSGKSERYKAAEMPWEAVLAKQAELAAVVPEVKRKKTLTAEQYTRLCQLVLLSLYTLMSPRRALDYTAMVVGPPTDNKNHNFYHEGVMTFNRFKTAPTAGTQTLQVPPELQSILALYLKHKRFDSPNLLHTARVDHMTPTTLTTALSTLFGKRVGVSMLRSLYLTSKFGASTQALKADTAAMGTSPAMAEAVYIKTE
jgi:hypothetical protein